YGCLVCGRYYAGRGKDTPLFVHALTTSHALYINLATTKIYCVPENYEVIDASLDDIKYNLQPKYTIEEIKRLTTTTVYSKTLNGADYIPGIIGLNSVNRTTDYINVIIQLITVITPIRNALLLLPPPGGGGLVIGKLSELIRKMYNPQNFKGLVSPHEFLQACHLASNKRFTLLNRSDAQEFFIWLL